eukprot:gene8521-biopygen9180
MSGSKNAPLLVRVNVRPCAAQVPLCGASAPVRFKCSCVVQVPLSMFGRTSDPVLFKCPCAAQVPLCGSSAPVRFKYPMCGSSAPLHVRANVRPCAVQVPLCGSSAPLR